MMNDFELMIKKAEEGDTDAQLLVAKRYATGDGIPRDSEKAYAWYLRWVSLNVQKSFVGFIGLHSLGEAEGDELKFCRRAADEGHVWAQFHLGWFYFVGLKPGVEKDHAEAARLFSMAAEQGFAPAQHTLGVMYLRGDHVAEDREMARDWIGKAAAQGYEQAMAVLARIS